MELSEYRLKELGRLTAKYVKKFYEDPENEKRFQEWYRQNYGETNNNESTEGENDIVLTM